MSDTLLCACGDFLTIEAVCVNCHVAELAAKDASIETWKSRSDRCDQQANMWEQRALEAGARAEKAEAELADAHSEIERLRAELKTNSDDYHDEVNRLATMTTRAIEGMNELEAELAEARRERDRLREALEKIASSNGTSTGAIMLAEIARDALEGKP